MAEAWKEVRVFISSTFRDMQAERDHLVRFVFPRLREELLKRRIHLVDVDLRWGVKADQDAFDLCMDEIELCHPRFICMLGGRYGWVPPPKNVQKDTMDQVQTGKSPAGDLTSKQLASLASLYELDNKAEMYRLRKKPAEKAEVEAWNKHADVVVEVFQQARLPDVERSITSSEVHFGALDKLNEPIFRYFYFREPAVTNSIPDKLAADYREKPGSDTEKALAELKERVEKAEGLLETAPGVKAKAKFRPYVYPCRWDKASERIVDLTSFGNRVYEDLLQSVNAQFGTAPPEKPDVFEEENAVLEAFIETRLERYVVGNRKPVFDALRAHAEGVGGNGYLCVVGEPGSGKTALLGKFYRDYIQGTPDVPAHGADLVVPHFIGVNATNVREVLRRLCRELAVGAAVPDEIPVDYENLLKVFPEFLKKAANAKHVVLLIDAVNQLDPAHGAHAMTWLPGRLPDNARVIVTALPGPVLEALRSRPEPPVEAVLPPLSEDDANTIINKFLGRYRKTLEKDQRAALLDKKEKGSPLYLLTALEELRTLGTYELTPCIEEMPGEVQPLFDWILKRLEDDPGFRDENGRLVGKEVVEGYCSYLSLGRSGMAQAELVDLVTPADEGKQIPADPQGNVAALRALMLPYLMRRGELLDFFHGQIREAVQERYLKEKQKHLEAHRAIARYFSRKADPAEDGTWAGESLRGLSELPYHQTGAEKWDELFQTLTNFRFLERKAADVGVVEIPGAEGTKRKTHTGVLLLQDDFDLVLEKHPGDGEGRRVGVGGRHPIIVTAVDLGSGLAIRCPFCNTSKPLDKGWLGKEIKCPQEGCNGPLRVNLFVATRPSWLEKSQ